MTRTKMTSAFPRKATTVKREKIMYVRSVFPSTCMRKNKTDLKENNKRIMRNKREDRGIERDHNEVERDKIGMERDQNEI